MMNMETANESTVRKSLKRFEEVQKQLDHFRQAYSTLPTHTFIEARFVHLREGLEGEPVIELQADEYPLAYRFPIDRFCGVDIRWTFDPDKTDK